MAQQSSEKLGQKTASGVVWNYLSFAANKGTTFVATLILARLLEPADFGLLALALLAISYLEIFNNFGFSESIIYYQEEEMDHIAFGINMLIGFVMMVITILLSPLIADFFNEPRLVLILHVLSSSFILSSIGSVHQAKLKKDLRFKLLFFPIAARAIIKGIISIGLALSGFGVWSLVLGQVAGVAAGTVFLWITTRWIPKPAFNWKKARALMNYSWQMTFVTLFGVFQKDVDYIMLGRLSTATQLGYYSIGYRLVEMLIVRFNHTVAQAIFPAFAKIQNDMDRLRAGFLKTLEYTASYTIPASLGLFIIAQDFVIVFYTERWLPAVAVVQIIALQALITSLTYNMGDVYKAVGKPSILNQIALVRIVISVPLFYFAASRSIYLVALVQLLMAILFMVLNLIIANRIIRISPGHLVKALLPALLSSTVMFVGTWLIGMLLGDIQASLRLLALMVSGAILYIAATMLFNREIMIRVFKMIRKKNK